MMETWKPIKDYEGIYEISSRGRVRSMDRVNYVGSKYKGKVLKLKSNTNGYLQVCLHKEGKRKFDYIHRLVAKAFCDGFDQSLEVCHNDGDKTNNHYTNLRWDTQSGNYSDRFKHGTHSRGERSGMAKLTNQQAIEIRSSYDTGNYTYQKLADMYNVHQATIGNIIKYKTFKHV